MQPWTASATSRHQTDNEKAQKLVLIRLLRNDLEKVRMLVEQVKKREKKKLERVLLFKTVVDEFVFEREKGMRQVLAKIAA
jgi:NuA3 HAT complex component NTO1